MSDLDSTLTDYGLTLLCSAFAWALMRRSTESSALKRVWVIFFAAVALASLTGGTVHGFLSDETDILYKLLWTLTLVAIGLATAAVWMIAGVVTSGLERLRPWFYFALGSFNLYLLVIFFISQNYSVVIINYAPAMLYLLIVSAHKWVKFRHRDCFYLFVGMGITFVAAMIQQMQLALHQTYFDHNATYHLVQGFGLWALYMGALKQIAGIRAGVRL